MAAYAVRKPLLDKLAYMTDAYPLDMRVREDYRPYKILYIGSSAFSENENRQNIRSTGLNLRMYASNLSETEPNREEDLDAYMAEDSTSSFLAALKAKIVGVQAGNMSYTMQQLCLVNAERESTPATEYGDLEAAVHEKCPELIRRGNLLSHAQGKRCVFAVVTGAYYAHLTAVVKNEHETSAGGNACLPLLPTDVDVRVGLSRGHRLGLLKQGAIGINMKCFSMKRLEEAETEETEEKWGISNLISIGSGRMPPMLEAALVWTSRSLKRKFFMKLNGERFRSLTVFDVNIVVERNGFLDEQSKSHLLSIAGTSDVDDDNNEGDEGDEDSNSEDDMDFDNDVEDNMDSSNDKHGGGAEDRDGNSGDNMDLDDSKWDGDAEGSFFPAREELKDSEVVSAVLPGVSTFTPPLRVRRTRSFTSSPSVPQPHSSDLPEVSLTARIRGGGSQKDEIDQDGFIMGGFDLRSLKDSNFGIAVLPMSLDAFAYEDFDNFLSWRTLSKTEEVVEYASEQTESPLKDQLLALVLSCIGGALHSRNDLENALREYQKALEIQDRLWPNSLIVADTCKNIGDVMKDTHHMEGTLDMYLRALTIQQKSKGLAPHWQVAETRADIEQIVDRIPAPATKFRYVDRINVDEYSIPAMRVLEETVQALQECLEFLEHRPRAHNKVVSLILETEAAINALARHTLVYQKGSRSQQPSGTRATETTTHVYKMVDTTDTAPDHKEDIEALESVLPRIQNKVAHGLIKGLIEAVNMSFRILDRGRHVHQGST